MSNFEFKRKNKYESKAFFVPEFKSSFQEKNFKNQSTKYEKSKKFNLLVIPKQKTV